jgi:hypothetical protein
MVEAARLAEVEEVEEGGAFYRLSISRFAGIESGFVVAEAIGGLCVRKLHLRTHTHQGFMGLFDTFPQSKTL